MSVFKYLCANCGSQLRKPPCVAPTDRTEKALATLGTWRCPNGCPNAKAKRERISKGAR